MYSDHMTAQIGKHGTHFIIGADAKRYPDSELSSIEREEIKQTFLQIGQCEEQGDNSYTYEYKYSKIKLLT